MKLFRDTNVLSLDGGEDEEGIDVSAIKNLRYETFPLPVEDPIMLDQVLESLAELQRKVISTSFSTRKSLRARSAVC